MCLFAILHSVSFAAEPLNDNDFQIGPFRLNAPFDLNLAKTYFGTPEIKNSNDGQDIKFQKAAFTIDKENKISQITIFEPSNFSTPRGLKPGDSSERTIELY